MSNVDQPFIPEQALDRDCMTLSRHVLQQLHSFGAEAQDLSAIMNRIALAAKLIARRLTRAGLVAGALGFTGEMNVQGESVKKMDVYANDVFISVFKQSGLVCRLASEEMEKPYYIPENCPIGRYTLLMTRLMDRPMLILISTLVLSSQFANKRVWTKMARLAICCKIMDAIKSPLVMYYTDPSTMLVYSIGTGVHAFTLDPSLGEFILSSENIRLPDHGSIYSVNEGNFWQWEEPLRDYIRYVHRHEGYTARYGWGHWWGIFTGFYSKEVFSSILVR
jgi:fructose-1,6-bisphosphatase I